MEMPHELNHSDEDGQAKVRIEYLEKLARSNLFGMDLLASLGELNHDAALSGNPDNIMALAGEHLRRLIPFDRMAFYRVDEPHAEFALSLVEPSRERQQIEQDTNEQIDNGNFAWAVRQNRPVVVSQNGGGGLLVLHVLATRSRVRGMFVAVLTGAEQKVDEALLNPLSIILQNTAYGLEGAELYRLISEKNNNLENAVLERTRELEEQAAKLKEEIAHRSLAEGSLTVAREEVGAGVRIKSDFIAHISHEFRTPLNAILGYGEILKFEAQKMNRSDLVEDLESIETSGKHLLRLVNDILDFSKIEAGKVELKFESVQVADLIEEVMTTIRPLVKKNDNVISVIYQGGDETMYSDPTRVRQILLNLLSNACKFTEDGSIVLTVSSQTAEDKPWLQFTVQDSGVGIEPEKILTLFNEFTQGEVTTMRKFGGTGLGLAICHRLCQMLGGDISVSSKPGRGSVFTVNLPADSRLVAEKRVSADGEDAVFDAPEFELQTPDAKVPSTLAPAPVEKDDRDVLLVIDDDQIVRGNCARMPSCWM